MSKHAAGGSLLLDGIMFSGTGCDFCEVAPAAGREQDLEKVRKAAEAETAARYQKIIAANDKRNAGLLEKAAREWQRVLSQMQADIQEQLIDLSVRIAERLLNRELPDCDMVRRVLESTLAPVSDLQGVRVRLSRSDLEMLRSATAASGERWQFTELVEDASLKPGDVLIESRNGYFDGRIRERLDYLAEKLKSVNGTGA